jgi:hypothetical protein
VEDPQGLPLPAAGENPRASNHSSAQIRALEALNPDSVSDAQVRDVLAHFPAPRVLLFNGVVAPVRMDRMAKFFIAKAYPRASFVQPSTGRMSHPSRSHAQRWAGSLPWYYEKEGLRPVLIGHSQGGMIVSKILHESAGSFGSGLQVYNPEKRRFEDRNTFRNPRSGTTEPIIHYRTPYASAIATGKMMRVVLGQWNMIEHLHTVPNSVERFTGFSLQGDLIGGGTHHYQSEGRAQIRNITLQHSANHLTLPALSDDPRDPRSLLAGVLWEELKRAWCKELQSQLR